MEVDQPRERLRISRDDRVLIFVFLGWEIATIFDVLDPQRRLEFDLVAFFFERSERIQLKNQVNKKLVGQFDSEGT